MPSTLHLSIEYKFLNELYGTDGKWKDAPDEWGLDIMRLTADGDELEFEASDGAGNQLGMTL